MIEGEPIKKKMFPRRRLRGVQKRRVKLRERMAMNIYVLPNLFTTANMFCGFFSVIYAIKGEFLISAYAIVAAAVFDFFDGRVARMTNTTSHFGAEYDSLSDLISFCMAPGILMFLWALQPFGRIGWLVSFLFLACGALRLARFNVQAHIVESTAFEGLPTPMAAGIVASAVLAFTELKWEASKSPLLLGMTLLLAIVMVSRFRYRSFKDLDLRERVPFRFLVSAVTILVVIAWWPEVMLFVVFMTYAILGAVFGILGIGKQPSPAQVYISHTESGDEDDDNYPGAQ